MKCIQDVLVIWLLEQYIYCYRSYEYVKLNEQNIISVDGENFKGLNAYINCPQNIDFWCS